MAEPFACLSLKSVELQLILQALRLLRPRLSLPYVCCVFSLRFFQERQLACLLLERRQVRPELLQAFARKRRPL